MLFDKEPLFALIGKECADGVCARFCVSWHWARFKLDSAVPYSIDF